MACGPPFHCTPSINHSTVHSPSVSASNKLTDARNHLGVLLCQKEVPFCTKTSSSVFSHAPFCLMPGSKCYLFNQLRMVGDWELQLNETWKLLGTVPFQTAVLICRVSWDYWAPNNVSISPSNESYHFFSSVRITWILFRLSRLFRWCMMVEDAYMYFLCASNLGTYPTSLRKE